MAVSPGLLPENLKEKVNSSKTVEEGTRSLLRAFTCMDMPEDPDRIFLSCRGEWWAASKIHHTLDKELQNKWSPGKEALRLEWNREVGYEGD
ncbi:hypothetical protein PG997_001951 [Apiospora hydei]|uniref:Uncharacterized protein n=1 Tax=Apiospora hydei TaxID=1337664 RepID=A0ABR1X841_9PEZI